MTYPTEYDPDTGFVPNIGLEPGVAGQKNKASVCNDNFQKMLSHLAEEVDGAKNYVDGYMPTMIGQNGKFLTTNGTTASWDIILHAGTIMLYGGSSAPTGWLICDGSAVSRTTYAALFAKIGTTFGAGDGSTTFNLPYLIGRYPFGTTSVGSTTSAASSWTGSANLNHTHTYGTTTATGFYNTGASLGDHAHTYTAGVNGLGLLPIIKY